MKNVRDFFSSQPPHDDEKMNVDDFLYHKMFHISGFILGRGKKNMEKLCKAVKPDTSWRRIFDEDSPFVIFPMELFF